LAVKGQPAQAITELRRLLDHSVNDANVHNAIGDLCLKFTSSREAGEAFHQAAGIFLQHGFALKAVAIYKKILKIDPDRADIYELLGDLSVERGLTSNAVADYLAGAKLYLKAGHIRKAIGAYRKITTTNPSNTSARLRVAELCLKEGLTDEAVDAYLQLARDSEQLHNEEYAQALYEQILKVAPHHPEARRRLVRDLPAKAKPATAPEPSPVVPPAPEIALAPAEDLGPPVSHEAERPSVPEVEPEPEGPDLTTIDLLGGRDSLPEAPPPAVNPEAAPAPLEVPAPPALPMEALAPEGGLTEGGQEDTAPPEEVLEPVASTSDQEPQEPLVEPIPVSPVQLEVEPVPLEVEVEVEEVVDEEASSEEWQTLELVPVGEVAMPAGEVAEGDGDVETHYDLGVAYKEMGLLTEAMEEFQLSARGPDRFVDSCIMTAACYKERTLIKSAIACLERALDNPLCEGPGVPFLKYDLALLYMEEGLTDKAARLYSTIPSIRDAVERLSNLQQQAPAAGPASAEEPDRASTPGEKQDPRRTSFM
jgi:tetratricopeptide (TPR) repeat protein